MRIIFVADYFEKDLPGGSEKSLQALIDVAPMPVITIRSTRFRMRDYTPDDFIIFGNFHDLPLTFIPIIAKTMNYAIIESDHKYCIERSPEQHKHRLGIECDCHKKDYGKRICAFYENAKVLFWKSTIHMRRHLDAFPILELNDNIVLSATYKKFDLDYLLLKSRKHHLFGRHGYAVFKSSNWIKGYSDARDYCKSHNLWRRDIGKMNWKHTIDFLSECHGLVFLPRSMESCSRIAIEAHILGIDLIINKNVPVTQEEWFKWSKEKIAEYLNGRPVVFWEKIMEYAKDQTPVTAEVVA